MTNLAHAVEIAQQAHRGQTDKTGRPYYEHCVRVSKGVDSLDGKIVAYLHDVVEKGGWTLAQLHETGFSAQVVAAVDALTRRDHESEGQFVLRALANDLARPVKHADLLDNCQQASAMGLPTKKYEDALAIIGGASDGDKRGDVSSQVPRANSSRV